MEQYGIVISKPYLTIILDNNTTFPAIFAMYGNVLTCEDLDSSIAEKCTSFVDKHISNSAPEVIGLRDVSTSKYAVIVGDAIPSKDPIMYPEYIPTCNDVTYITIDRKTSDSGLFLAIHHTTRELIFPMLLNCSAELKMAMIYEDEENDNIYNIIVSSLGLQSGKRSYTVNSPNNEVVSLNGDEARHVVSQTSLSLSVDSFSTSMNHPHIVKINISSDNTNQLRFNTLKC